ncbi:CCA tRNA nucleotidyltransferase [Helicobacter cappadocius]|uniref:CCA tRNA nucleotidyltransferase n=1 Tax=Helicobacter cappadocius TaxID=3063998 RepID=A0AA90PVY6_9HELI|nr:MULTISPECIES: hypothetical protein [unclassified Helicobacter]MDO7253310.1 hypothetical protein [Helicobacter sp. faydin-H75]MDP2539260.1 hypothetical protein [Helicobacter sp. faydin-H76]
MFEISLPQEVSKIINILEKKGFEAYVVGGCVRDSVMNILNISSTAPNDWDITTSAKPDEVMEILAKEGIKTIPTGIKHGTITAIIEKQKYEITTYRIEGKYTSHRTPLEVEFVSTLIDDLSRRDFTINAMAYHPHRGIVDIYEGINHLKQQLICAIRDPNERFEEDALRILRALRFSARFGFEINEQTSRAIFKHKELLSFISIERITEELKGILCGEFAFDILDQYHEVILFSLTGDKLNYPYYKDAIKIIPYCPKNPITRIIVLLYFGIVDEAQRIKILQRLRFPKWIEKTILDIMKHLHRSLADEKIWIKQSLSLMGEKNFKIFLEIKNAQMNAKKPISEDEHLKLHGIFEKFQKIIENKEPIHIKDLMLDGNDLQTFGIPKGKKIKEMLHKMLEAVMSEKISNDKKSLEDFVYQNIDKLHV